MRRPRRLSPQEAELWARVAGTVRPLNPPRNREGDHAQHGGAARAVSPDIDRLGKAAPAPPSLRGPSPRAGEERVRTLDRHGLDGSWDKKLARAEVHPDFTLDLHGHTLDSAHVRLDHGLAQALALGARVVLLITGKSRPSEAADRGGQRGAIRAKVLDWLAAGPHASKIAAVRGAHRKHGGAGALYVVLRRSR